MSSDRPLVPGSKPPVDDSAGLDTAARRADRSAASPLGAHIRGLRRGRGWTLNALSDRCGLSRSALSKIERGEASPTFGALQKIARGFGLAPGDLIAPRAGSGAGGRRSVTRAGAGEAYVTEKYRHRLHAAELSHKAFLAFHSVVTARSLDDFADWDRHDSEDFLYVLSGAVTVFTEHDAPVTLAVGDSLYLDGRVGHAVVSDSAEAAVMLWISAP